MQSLRERPVSLELLAVELDPLLHEPNGARGELAVQRIARGDRYPRSIVRVPRLEVRRVVIVEEHRHHDAIDVPASGAYPVGLMTRAGETFILFGFAARIFAR